MGKSKAAKPKAAPKAAPAPAAPLKAHGTTTKRTPTSAFDGAAGNDVYEPEKVLASRLAREVKRSTSSSGSGTRARTIHGRRGGW